jgi:hypothetical protein
MRLNLVNRDFPNYIATSQDRCSVRVFAVVSDLTIHYNCCVSSINTIVVPDFRTSYSCCRVCHVSTNIVPDFVTH